MDNKLARLPRAACKQGSEYGNVQPPLHRRVRHLHIGRRVLVLQIGGFKRGGIREFHALVFLEGERLVPAAPAAGGLLGAVELGHVARVHVDHGGHAAVEHALPLLLLDVLAVIAAGQGLGRPFLLEECARDEVRDPGPEYVVEVVFVGRLTEALCVLAVYSREVHGDTVSVSGRKTHWPPQSVESQSSPELHLDAYNRIGSGNP